MRLLNLWTASKNIELEASEQLNISKRLFGFTRSEILSMLNLSFIKYETINLDIVNERK